MLRKYLTITYVLLSIFCSFANNDVTVTGARSTAMGNASVTLYDIWSTNNNQAGLGFIKQTQVSTSYENRFLIKELGLAAGTVVLPIKAGTFGLSINHFGYTNYNQTKYGLAFGKAFGENISAGIF